MLRNRLIMNWVDPGSMATEMMAQADPNPNYPLADPQNVVDVFLYLTSQETMDIHGQRFVAQNLSGGRTNSGLNPLAVQV